MTGGRRVLDLFCGAAGGWSHGVEQVGWRVVAAAESDPVRRAIYAAVHPDAILYDDVRDVTAARLRADLGYLPDIVVGSPPCQDISAANAGGEGTGGARSGLFWEWLRIVDEIRPDWACAENSPRARTRGFDDVAAGLEAIGYACWPLVVGAAHAGANHDRRRVWIVAADPDRLREHQPQGCDAEQRGRDRDRALRPAAADAAGTRHPVGQGERDDDGGQLPAPLRDIGNAWPDWNGGLAGLAASCAAARPDRVDDGLPARLAVRARNVCIAAYGDAVVPAITRAIATTIETVEREIATWA